MIALLLRIYPPAWRDRYGEEFAAMLELRPLGPFDVADVLLGALDAHLHLRGLGAVSEHRKGFAMSLRIGGYAAIIGGGLTLALIVGGALLPNNGAMWFPLSFIAIAALLVALVGLSAFQARKHPRLVWAAFVIPALGASISLVGLVGMALVGDGRFIGQWSGWAVWIAGLLAMFLGSTLFAIATWRTHALSRAASALLGLGALLVIPLAGGIDFLGFLPEVFARVVTVIAVIGFAAGWAGLGISAIRITGPARNQIEGASL